MGNASQGEQSRSDAQLVERARASLVVEKPFGRALASARALNATIHRILPEDSVFRIDHFLGKEAVQNVDPVIHGPSPMFEHEPGFNR